MSCTILLPVDGSDCSERAIRHVIKIAGMVPDLVVHLLNVQPTGDDWTLRRKLKPEELEALEREWGESAIAPARASLEGAGVDCTVHVVQGDTAETIARLAASLSCDQIVMGTQGRSSLAGVLLGSMANQVLHLSSVPVTLVK